MNKDFKKPTKIAIVIGFVAFLLVGFMSSIYPKTVNKVDGELSDLKIYIIKGNYHEEMLGLKNYTEDGSLLFTGEDIDKFDWISQTVKMKQEFMDKRINNNTDKFRGGSQVLGV